MNKLKKLCSALLCLSLLLALTAPCFAAEYTYTVTLYAGNHGVFKSSGSDTLTITAHLGDRITFNVNSNTVELQSDKYYLRGVRLSGHEDTETASLSTVVTGDLMYVVSYGIKGEMTSYTVNYLDENGAPLAESQTFYGNVGDKPVVAFAYVEGYEPQAYNLTKTLSANAAENVFDFVYHSLATEEPPEEEPTEEPETTVTTVAPEAAPEEGEETAPEGGDTETPTAETTEPSTDPITILPENETPTAGTTGGDEGETENENVPEEIMDLDVPLAEPEVADEAADSGLSTPAIVGIVGGSAAAVALLLGLLVAVRKRRRKA